MDPRQIAHIMGGDVTGRDSVNVPGPNHSKADRSLAIKINARAPGGFVVFSHCGDDPIHCRDYVRDALGLEKFNSTQRYTPTPLSVTIGNGDKDAARRKAFAEQIWQQSTSPIGTVVERYLQSRALSLPNEVVGSVVRYHARLKYGDQYLPGMVCLMRGIKSDEPTGVHRTFLSPNAEKIDRRMLGIAKDAAIKVDPNANAEGRLALGEGFETSLAARHAGLGPVWAMGSAVAIKAFPVLEQVKRLTLLGENDTASRLSVRAVRDRYLKARCPVDVVMPRRGLKDLNDAWRETFAR